jgi:Protein of unknown function (DUF2793)
VAATTNLQLPLLVSNQAQKDVTVNQALTQIDALTQLSIISRVISAPPVSPSNEDAYIIPAGASGSWTGLTNQIAVYYASMAAWLFLPPKNGWLAWSQADGAYYAYYGSTWQATVANQPPFPGAKGSFTLVANAASTQVTAAGCTPTSVVIPIAATQHAAQDATDLYITTGTGQFTAYHASNSRADRTFNYMLFY